ncbi:hypothetical protein F5888DRAFT_1729238, partial [Russula emetica]
FGILLSPIIVLLLLSSVRSCAEVLEARSSLFTKELGLSTLRLRHTPMPTRHLVNVTAMSLTVMAPQWNETSMRCRPSNESGAASTHHK